jgi:hypothetical protein
LWQRKALILISLGYLTTSTHSCETRQAFGDVATYQPQKLFGANAVSFTVLPIDLCPR